MIPIDQTKLHSSTQNGNCFAASLASILEMPLSSIPEFENMNLDLWWENFVKWLASIGFTVVYWDQEIELPGLYLVMGTSPRDESINHQVIYQDGKMIHDPHPSRDGVTKVKEVIVLVPLDPAAHISPGRDHHCRHWTTCFAGHLECQGVRNCPDGEPLYDK